MSLFSFSITQRKYSVAVALLVLLVVAETGVSQAPLPAVRKSTAPVKVAAHSASDIRDIDNQELLLAELNLYRVRHGLKSLAWSPTASAAARLQALYNLTNHTHGHSNSQYPASTDRLKAVGHKYQPSLYFTEYNREVCVRVQKVTAHYVSVIDSLIMNGYQRSPSHNEALLDPEVRKVGIATVYDGWEVQNTMVLCI